jgi:hypothetical protein
MQGLYGIYMNGQINDINKSINIINFELFDGTINVYDQIDWLYPIILIIGYPKIVNYYLLHKLTEDDYSVRVYNNDILKSMYNRELFRDLTLILLSLNMDNFDELIAYGMSDKFKINLLQLLGIDLTKHSISTDDLDEIRNTDLGRYLISKKINVV